MPNPRYKENGKRSVLSEGVASMNEIEILEIRKKGKWILGRK